MHRTSRDVRSPLTTMCAAVLAGLALASPRAASAQAFWTDWTAATPTAGATLGTASGTLSLPGQAPLTVSYLGDFFAAQTSGGTDYWTPRPPNPASPYVNATLGISNPTNTDILRLTGGNSVTHTITFSRAITNPVFAILSLGASGTLVTYNFNRPFEITSFGPGFFGGPGTLTALNDPANNSYRLTGNEGHGAIRFLGTFESISWTVPTFENWHGFTIGVQGEAAQAVIPEPATVALVAAGLALVGAVGARRRARS